MKKGNNITVRKLKIIPVHKNGEINTDAYNFIYDATYAQYRALNLAYTHLSNAYYTDMNIKSEHFKESKKALTNSHKMFDDIAFGTGIDTKSMVVQKAKKHFDADFKQGIAKGERSARNYKRTYPLMVRSRDLEMYYGEEGEIYIKWVHKIIFKVIIGRKDKDYMELMHTLNKIISKEYKVQESTISSNKGKILILNLNINMGEINSSTEDAKNVMGVDLGINIPALACLSQNTYIRRSFGSKDDFLKVRQQFKERRMKVQKSLVFARGGHGRDRKLSAMERFKEHEKNYVKTYNHKLSKQIIDFAIQNKVGQINLEKLTKDGFDDKLLGVWSYYQLQQMIEYKAQRESIIVKYVNAAYTSQKCSKCGYTHADNRPTQERFECGECGFKLNADHNAAINIAKSEEYVKNK